jgi:hypothetical protein
MSSREEWRQCGDKLLIQGLKGVRENGWNIESDAESGGISLVGITEVGE